MLPEPEHLPPCRSQLLRYHPVTLFVALQFRQPICLVAAGFPAVLGAPMPETAVHEHRDPLARKDKIWPSRDVGVAAPACDPARSENDDHFQFRVFIALGPDRRHHGRTFFFGKYVGHKGSILPAHTAPMDHRVCDFHLIEWTPMPGRQIPPAANQANGRYDAVEQRLPQMAVSARAKTAPEKPVRIEKHASGGPLDAGGRRRGERFHLPLPRRGVSWPSWVSSGSSDGGG